MKRRVLIYSLEDNLALAQSYLEEHGVADQFELASRTHAPFTTPSRAELAGFDAVLGELCPIRGTAVDDFAGAGVRLYASLSIGVNHIDVAALAARGVTVANCPGYCAEDVALHALALMLDLMRQVTTSNRRVTSGGWTPLGGYPMRRTASLTCGLVFFGSIARELVPLVKALGMRVLVWAPTKSAEELAAAGCQKAETLDELLAQSDVVSLHCPLIPATERLVGARELALMKPTAFLVNTARGGVVDEDALADALERGVIQGAGLDVLTNETSINERLVNAPNCVVTPHSAYISEEALADLVRLAMKSVVELFCEGREPEFRVLP